MRQSDDRTRIARRLRSKPTRAEAKFWELVRGRRFRGLKFRREVPLAGFIADFYCPALRLAVELDGGVHDLKEVEDTVRTERLERAGFVVIRARNEAFLRNPNPLLDAIAAEAERTQPAPSSVFPGASPGEPPSPPRGEG